MEITGTNKAMDLWSDIQFMKNMVKKQEDKKRVINLYQFYKIVGGKRIDEEIEKWKKEE